MHKIQVRPIPGRELAKQQSSTFHHSSLSGIFTAILSINPSCRGIAPTRILMILVGCVSIVACGCGGLALNQGTGASPTKSLGKNSPFLSQISCGTKSLTGPQTKACSAYLNSPATTAVAVYLQSNNPAVKVPSTATVLAGSSVAGFSAVAAGVSSTQSVTLTASVGSSSTTTAIQLYPAPTTLPSVLSISCASQSLTGPQTRACSVNINAAAPIAILFSLASNNPAVTLPASVTIGYGATSASFNVTAAAVKTSQTVTLTASAYGYSASDLIQLLATNGALSAPQYQVQLNWYAPTSATSSIAGYRVYRAPGGATSFQALNSSIDQYTSFTDSTVQSGQSYEYQVKSVDTKGSESAPSNATLITIP